MPLLQLSENEILKLGLDTAGFKETRQQTVYGTKLDRFRSVFGPLPKTAADVFGLIQEEEKAGEFCIVKPNAIYFLMTLSWLNSYNNEHHLAGAFGINEKTVRKWIWTYSRAIQALKDSVIIWRWDDNNPPTDNIFILSVDGTHCRIQEPRKTPSAEWYSHKFKKPGLTYEIAVDITQSKIAWVNGPYPAGQNDLTVFRKDVVGLKWRIPFGKKVIADNGYQGPEADAMLSTPNDLDSDAVKHFKKRARARHETVNKKMKDYAILENRFRHSVGKHQTVFEAAVVLVQVDMDNGLELFRI